MRSVTKPPAQLERFEGWYIPVRGAARLFFALLGGRSVYGHENIPTTGPAIVAANHVSMTDPMLVPSCIDRPIAVMAKEELFKIPVIGTILRKVGSFPVKRGAADRAALRHSMDLLESGKLVLIFPEGHRGSGVDLLPPQRGMGMIALKTGAPIVPAYAHGTLRMFPRGAKLPRRTHTSVTFGKPIFPADFPAGRGADEALGQAVMEAISALRDAVKQKESLAGLT